MNCRLTFVLVLALSCRLLSDVGAARADVGPYIPLDVRVRFVNLADYPDHDFYLKYGLGRGNPYGSMHLTRVESGAETRLEGDGNRVTEVYLLAVARGASVASAPPAGSDAGRDWLTVIPPGALRSGPLSVRSGHVVSYSIRVDSDRLEVESVGPGVPASDGGATGDWQIALGVAGAAAALVAAVIWRRRRP